MDEPTTEEIRAALNAATPGAVGGVFPTPTATRFVTLPSPVGTSLGGVPT